MPIGLQMRYAVGMAHTRWPLAFTAASALCFAALGAPALCAPVTYTVVPGPLQLARFDASTRTEHYSGRTNQVSGMLQFDDAAPAQATAQFSVKLSSLATGSSLRDSNMRRLVLQTDTFPTATFRLTRLAPPVSPLLPGQTAHVLAQGTLTLHGVTQPVLAPVDVTRETGAGGLPSLHIKARFVVRLNDYGLHAPRFLFFTVRQEHTLTADLHAVAAPRRERPASARRN